MFLLLLFEAGAPPQKNPPKNKNKKKQTNKQKTTKKHGRNVVDFRRYESVVMCSLTGTSMLTIIKGMRLRQYAHAVY